MHAVGRTYVYVYITQNRRTIMKTLILTGQEILQLGFPQGKVVGAIIRVVSENYTCEQKEYVLNFLKGVTRHPERFLEHKIFGEVVEILLNIQQDRRKQGRRAPLIDHEYAGRPLTEVELA